MEREENMPQRGSLFWFDGTNSPFAYPTNVVLIPGREHWYLLDTHVGNGSMEQLRSRHPDMGRERPVRIFNTHHDWDHVWGNGAFASALVFSHEKCRSFMADDVLWAKALEDNGSQRDGNVLRRLPDLVFSDRIMFPEDNLEFFHTPGHTVDSASCFDHQTGVLYVGDNLELPLPYCQWHDLDRYIETLGQYRDRHPSVIVTAHSGTVSLDCLAETVDYLVCLRDKKPPRLTDPQAENIHQNNRKLVLFSWYEEQLRGFTGVKVEQKDLIAAFELLFSLSCEDIEKELNTRLDTIMNR